MFLIGSPILPGPGSQGLCESSLWGEHSSSDWSKCQDFRWVAFIGGQRRQVAKCQQATPPRSPFASLLQSASGARCLQVCLWQVLPALSALRLQAPLSCGQAQAAIGSSRGLGLRAGGRYARAQVSRWAVTNTALKVKAELCFPRGFRCLQGRGRLAPDGSFNMPSFNST